MKITTNLGGSDLMVEIADIPNEERLRNVDVNLKDQTINLYYDTDSITVPMQPQWSGELDVPGMPSMMPGVSPSEPTVNPTTPEVKPIAETAPES